MYATPGELTRNLGNFADCYRLSGLLPVGSSEFDEELMAEDLAAASAEVDGYLCARYLVPVTQAEALALLRSWTLAIAAELAFGRSDVAEVPAKFVERSKVVRANLAEVAKGNFPLPAAPAETTDKGGGVAVLSVAPPVFTRDQMGGF